MKNTKVKSIVVAFASIFITMTSCQKYEDGPAISLRTKTERVANDWKINSATENNQDVTGDYNKYELNLTKGGEATLTADYSFAGVSYQYTTEGTWSFASDKEKIAFNFDNDDADGIYEILKLKEDEMWLKEDGESLELHFVTR